MPSAGAENVFADATCTPGISSDTIAKPKLKPLAANGGATRTHATKPASPAIDKVTVGCPPPSDDQRGIARPQGADCDAGAYEREP